jgi:hypothetical protein
MLGDRDRLNGDLEVVIDDDTESLTDRAIFGHTDVANLMHQLPP